MIVIFVLEIGVFGLKFFWLFFEKILCFVNVKIFFLKVVVLLEIFLYGFVIGFFFFILSVL